MSSTYEWHRHNHVRILTSYAGLTAEQRGVAYTLLDLIYDRRGPLVEHEKVLAARMNMGAAKFRRIRDELIGMGKFYVTESGHLMNKYAVDELEKTSNLSEIRAESGKKGGKNSGKSRKKSNENSETQKQELKQNRSRYTDRENVIAPIGANNIPLPPDGALALDRLRAAVGSNGHLRTDLAKFEISITDWLDDPGAFTVKSQWARDHFMERLRVPLRECGLTIACSEAPTPIEKKPRAPAVIIPLPSARSMEEATGGDAA